MIVSRAFATVKWIEVIVRQGETQIKPGQTPPSIPKVANRKVFEYDDGIRYSAPYVVGLTSGLIRRMKTKRVKAVGREGYGGLLDSK